VLCIGLVTSADFENAEVFFGDARHLGFLD